MRRLSALDSGFLALETDAAPLHIGALLVLDGPAPDVDLVRSELARRAASVEECRQRVHRPAGSLRRPVWVDAPVLAPESHVHVASLDRPGDRAALRRRVAELMSVRLDTSGPLWEVWLIDGLTDGSWAVLVKAHHTLTDGFSGAGLLAALLSPSHGHVAQTAPHAEARSRPPLPQRVRRLRQGIRTVAVPDLPPNLLNGTLGPGRSWDWFSADLADLSRVADRADCTLNDVYLTVMTGCLRSVLAAGASLTPVTRVRVLVPVSMRRDGSGARSGNLDAALFVDLPLHLGSPVEMLADVARQTAAAKAAGVPIATEELLRAGDLVPAPLLDRAARAYVRHGQARVNLVASDVRGPSAPLEVCGRTVRDLVPCLPLALDVRVTSALISYAGRAIVSMTVDRNVAPDARALTSAAAEFLGDLVGGTR